MIAAILGIAYGLAALLFGLLALQPLLLTLTWARLPRRAPIEPSGPGSPRVTVQVPIYNERYVARRVIDAVCQLDWPSDRLEIQILDDSTDDTRGLVDAAAAYWRGRGVAVRVLRRADRRGFKAGALAAGLAQSRGELLAIFDADFVPAPDFLRCTVPHFGPGIGVVQARWAHLNADASKLTRAQTLALDSYFLIRQTVFSRLGLFLNFNGTAGLWRREAIEAAGGWQGDTLTEDVDLSYRAQLAGWRILVLPEVCVPAELPSTIAAFKRQQHRWTKGTWQVLRKLGATILRSDRPRSIRLLAFATFGGYLAYPLSLAMLLGTPLLLAFPPRFPAAMAALALAPLGPLVAFGVAQSALEDGHPRRLLTYPYLMVLSLGMAYTGTRAVFEGLAGRGGAFERTPKTGGEPVAAEPADLGYLLARDPSARVEAGLALYAALVSLTALARESWGLAAFTGLFALGLALSAGLGTALPRIDLARRLRTGRARRSRATGPGGL